MYSHIMLSILIRCLLGISPPELEPLIPSSTPYDPYYVLVYDQNRLTSKRCEADGYYDCYGKEGCFWYSSNDTKKKGWCGACEKLKTKNQCLSVFGCSFHEESKRCVGAFRMTEKGLWSFDKCHPYRQNIGALHFRIGFAVDNGAVRAFLERVKRRYQEEEKDFDTNGEEHDTKRMKNELRRQIEIDVLGPINKVYSQQIGIKFDLVDVYMWRYNQPDQEHQASHLLEDHPEFEEDGHFIGNLCPEKEKDGNQFPGMSARKRLKLFASWAQEMDKIIENKPGSWILLTACGMKNESKRGELGSAIQGQTVTSSAGRPNIKRPMIARLTLITLQDTRLGNQASRVGRTIIHELSHSFGALHTFAKFVKKCACADPHAHLSGERCPNPKGCECDQRGGLCMVNFDADCLDVEFWAETQTFMSHRACMLGLHGPFGIEYESDGGVMGIWTYQSGNKLLGKAQLHQKSILEVCQYVRHLLPPVNNLYENRSILLPFATNFNCVIQHLRLKPWFCTQEYKLDASLYEILKIFSFRPNDYACEKSSRVSQGDCKKLATKLAIFKIEYGGVLNDDDTDYPYGCIQKHDDRHIYFHDRRNTTRKNNLVTIICKKSEKVEESEPMISVAKAKLVMDEKKHDVNSILQDLSVEDFDKTNVCDMPKDFGIGRIEYQRRYFYDKEKQVCTKFRYWGDKENELTNNFKSRSDCESKCVHIQEYMTILPTPSLSSTIKKNRQSALMKLQNAINLYCLLPEEVGECNLKIRTFYYDVEHQRCATFRWSGCGGNLNNFATLEECEDKCIYYGNNHRKINTSVHSEKLMKKLESDIEQDAVSAINTYDGPSKCILGKDHGPCSWRVTRYYYDLSKNECEKFIWGGCEGNENKFPYKKECEETCKRSKMKPKPSTEAHPLDDYEFKRIDGKCMNKWDGVLYTHFDIKRGQGSRCGHLCRNEERCTGYSIDRQDCSLFYQKISQNLTKINAAENGDKDEKWGNCYIKPLNVGMMVHLPHRKNTKITIYEASYHWCAIGILVGKPDDDNLLKGWTIFFLNPNNLVHYDLIDGERTKRQRVENIKLQGINITPHATSKDGNIRFQFPYDKLKEAVQEKHPYFIIECGNDLKGRKYQHRRVYVGPKMVTVKLMTEPEIKTPHIDPRMR